MTEYDLRLRVQELEAENTALHDALAKLAKPPFRVRGLSLKENQILGLIYQTGDLITKRAVYDALYWAEADGGPDMKILDVMMCKIRKKLRPMGVKIETVWGDGWRMPSSSKQILRDLATCNNAS